MKAIHKTHILPPVLALCCMLVCTGCVANIKQTSAAALSYMKEKYGREFHLEGYEQGEYSSDSDMIRVYTDGMDLENEYIAVYPDSNDKTKFSDSYFNYLIRDDMESEIKSVLGTEDCKVYQTNSEYAFPDSLNADSTIMDLYQQFPGFMANENIYLPEQESRSEKDYQVMTETLASWIKDQQRSYSINLFVVSDDYYQTIDRYAQDEFWRYYATHRTADGETLIYVYTAIFINGELED